MTATPESRLSDYCDAWESAGTAGPVDMIDGAALYVSDLRAVLERADPRTMSEDDFLAFVDAWLEAKGERHQRAAEFARDLIAKTRAMTAALPPGETA